MEVLDGIVRSVIYNSGQYFILDVEPVGAEGYHKGQTAKGNVFGIRNIAAGVPICFQGKWVKNQKYGRQFQIKGWKPGIPKDPRNIRTFLSICIENFDYVTADHVVSRYGADTYTALEDPNKVAKDLEGVANPKDLQAALAGWERALAIRDLAEVLKDGGLNVSDIEAAVHRFGSDAPRIVHDNPYRLMEIQGFNFDKVDSLAVTLGIAEDNPIRLEGAALWALHEAARSGHLYLERGEIPKYTGGLKTSLPPSQGYKQALAALEARKAVIVEPGVGVYLADLYLYERASAEKIRELIAPSTLKVDFDPFLEEFERTSLLELSEAQIAAVRQLVDNKVLVLTGLPGTGKTTAVRALVRLFEATRTTFSLMAPTGIASKRLSNVAGYPASTIHRALGYDGSDWAMGPANKHVVDAVIVDEVSMVDMELLYRLLMALRKDTMLVLVGDDAQLPSVGPGNVLKELVTCSGVPAVSLSKIFRQSAGGDIVSNSHLINRGEYPILGDPKSDSEFKYIRLSDEEKIKQYIVKIAAKLKERDANFQVLAPKYGGTVGVDSLNEALREVLNPEGPPEWEGKYQRFREGDRLMVIKNDYQKGVYNGDMGKLLHITKDNLIVRIYGAADGMDMEASFTKAEAGEKLRLAYAITVHKSQGSEFDTIIMPVVNSQGLMLQRNLLYTAVTRAKKVVWLLGEESAIRKAVNNNKVIHRNTKLGRAVAGVLDGSDGGSTSEAQE